VEVDQVPGHDHVGPGFGEAALAHEGQEGAFELGAGPGGGAGVGGKGGSQSGGRAPGERARRSRSARPSRRS
jgi:hypothetical protein